MYVPPPHAGTHRATTDLTVPSFHGRIQVPLRRLEKRRFQADDEGRHDPHLVLRLPLLLLVRQRARPGLLVLLRQDGHGLPHARGAALHRRRRRRARQPVRQDGHRPRLHAARPLGRPRARHALPARRRRVEEVEPRARRADRRRRAQSQSPPLSLLPPPPN